MGEVSNKTLATLLIAAIVVSLVGTLISLNKVNNLMSITGMQTKDNDTGWVRGNIGNQSGIVVRENIDFGTCTVGTDSITIDSNSDNLGSGYCTNNCSTVGTDTPCDGLSLENIGNVNLSVTANFTEDAATFIGGTQGGGPLLKYASATGDPRGNLGGCTAGTQVAFAPVNTSNAHTICTELTEGNLTAFMTLEVQVRIPGDASGEKNQTVFIEGTEI